MVALLDRNLLCPRGCARDPWVAQVTGTCLEACLRPRFLLLPPRLFRCYLQDGRDSHRHLSVACPCCSYPPLWEVAQKFARLVRRVLLVVRHHYQRWPMPRLALPLGRLHPLTMASRFHQQGCTAIHRERVLAPQARRHPPGSWMHAMSWQAHSLRIHGTEAPWPSARLSLLGLRASLHEQRCPVQVWRSRPRPSLWPLAPQRTGEMVWELLRQRLPLS